MNAAQKAMEVSGREYSSSSSLVLLLSSFFPLRLFHMLITFLLLLLTALFPQLDHQKRVIAKSLKTQKWPNRSSWSSQSLKE